jgi:hypothetical protein
MIDDRGNEHENPSIGLEVRARHTSNWLAGNHYCAPCCHRYEWRIENIGSRRTASTCRTAHNRGDEINITTSPTDAVHRGSHLDDIAGAHRFVKRHGAVASEQAFVAVHADGELGCNVTEEAERVGTIDEVATVVGV